MLRWFEGFVEVLRRQRERSTGRLFFSFLFSFFLWIKLGLFLLFPPAFVFFSLITHICFSLFESGFSPDGFSQSPTMVAQWASDREIGPQHQMRTLERVPGIRDRLLGSPSVRGSLSLPPPRLPQPLEPKVRVVGIR